MICGFSSLLLEVTTQVNEVWRFSTSFPARNEDWFFKEPLSPTGKKVKNFNITTAVWRESDKKEEEEVEEEEGIKGIVAKAASSVNYLGNKFTPKKKILFID